MGSSLDIHHWKVPVQGPKLEVYLPSIRPVKEYPHQICQTWPYSQHLHFRVLKLPLIGMDGTWMGIAIFVAASCSKSMAYEE